jgi:hypothetical protein
VVDVHDTVYRPTTLSKFEIYFEEKDRVGVEQNIGIMTSSEGGFLPAGSRISDVVAMLIDANTFEWFKYRYNLKDSRM